MYGEISKSASVYKNDKYLVVNQSSSASDEKLPFRREKLPGK
jgi:hypothetical protein